MTEDEKYMIENIDDKLNEINVNNNYSDTNLVSKSLEKIKLFQAKGCSPMLKSFFLLSALIFISRVSLFIRFSLLMNLLLYHLLI